MQHCEHVIYLDFDGVLHPEDVRRDSRGRIFILSTDNAGKKIKSTKRLFENCQLLELALQPYPQVRIVLSTSWVKALRSYSKARSRLSKGLKDRTIGATFHSAMVFEKYSPYASNCAYDSQKRFEQILRDVDSRGVKSWLAIDDDDTDLPLVLRERHFIVPKTDQGLAEQAIYNDLKEKLSRTFSTVMGVR